MEGHVAGKFGIYSPLIKVKAPTKLKLTAYVQAEDLKALPGLTADTPGPAAAIMLTNKEENVLNDARFQFEPGTYAWKRIEVICPVPADAPEIKVFVQIYGTGRIWLDDVSLTGIALDTPLSATAVATEREFRSDAPLEKKLIFDFEEHRLAVEALEELRGTVEMAKAKGLDTSYAEIPLMLGDLAFEVRWTMPEHQHLKKEYAELVLDRASKADAELRKVMAGELPNLVVPPHPDYGKLELKGPYYEDEKGKRILFSMQYHHKGELTRWFAPGNYFRGIPGVGATRWNFHLTPIWSTHRADPETRRVYDGGWCGHIIKDEWSIGGLKGVRCVINLDHPRMLKAISQSIATAAARAEADDAKRGFSPLYINMGFEYSYYNYDKYSAYKYRHWLKRKYGKIENLNKVWKSDLLAFVNEENKPEVTEAPTGTGEMDIGLDGGDDEEEEVEDEDEDEGEDPEDVLGDSKKKVGEPYEAALPPYKGAVEKNPARYYDWGEFNLWRFTDYMKWARAEIQKHYPGVPTTTGGGQPFGSKIWKQGVDEEYLGVEGVCDIWLSETGSRALGVTSLMDLQRSLQPDKLIMDPEYHGRANTIFLMFLHGCGVLDYWWWPDEPGELMESSMKHSPNRPLLDVETTLRTALDVRRLPQYITAFRGEPPGIGILYSRASLIQQYPGTKGSKSPYTLDVERNYAAAVRLDTPVGFVSSRQVIEGKLKDYKLLAITSARFIKQPVYRNIISFVEGGGTLVITPGSLIADEYNRKRAYLGKIGITVESQKMPEFMAGKALSGVAQGEGEFDFIQGPVAQTLVAKQHSQDIVAGEAGRACGLPEAFTAEGLIQSVKASPEWTPLATFADREYPAVLVRDYGQGRIYYQTVQLDVAQQRLFMDAIAEKAGIIRPIRVTAEDGHLPATVESRTVKHSGKYLTYLHNSETERTSVVLKSGLQITRIFWLNKELELQPGPIALAPQETKLLLLDTL